MTDDPYRSLAWLVREAGGYKQLDTPFQEFAWTEYLRKHMVIGGKPNWKKLTEGGVKLARAEAARGLPGWIGSAAECPAALEKI